MAVMQNSIIFGGVDSADFGIYIGGEGTFNAPKRDVEMISIPGRNGAFALDKGRFENIEVTYSAFNFEPDLDTFSAQLEAFRNAICSQKGYQRLTDTFHPDEYRMAAYIDGLEIKPINFNTASTFDIVFDCKPQRFLTSGEEPITIGEWHETETASGEIASFEAEAGDAVKSLVVDIEPTQSGSGTPSPTNIRPISGHDEVNVSVCGKNLYDATTYPLTQGSYIDGANGNTAGGFSQYARVKIPCKHLRGQTVTLNKRPGGYSPGIAFYKEDNSFISGATNSGETAGTPWTFTVPANADILGFTTVGSDSEIQLELGTTATTYEPYNGTTYEVSFGTAGTVYGGTLDVASGVLTVDRAMVTLNGTESNTWYLSSASTRQTVYATPSLLPNVKTSVGYQQTAVCNSFGIALAYSQATIGMAYVDSGYFNMVFAPNTFSASADVKTWLASNNVQVVYELATPTTVQLTAEEVSALVGTNVLWANSGDVSVEYGTAPNVLVNPTLFEASPMLEVEGYGEIGVNGDVITIQNGELGEIKISDATQEEDVFLDVSNLNADDAIYSISGQLPCATMSLKLADASGTLDVTKRSSVTGGTAYISKINGYASEIRMSPVTTGGLSFRKGWSHTYTTTLPLTITINGTATNCTLTLTTVYNGGANTISLVFGSSDFPESGLRITSKYSHPVYYGSSTKVVLPSPMYIDLDLGEAYGEISDEIASFNGIVQMPANPPTLRAGANEITFDNTITDLKVVPRWWKI